MPQQVDASSFEFVVGNRPEQLNGTASSRLRSYLSKRSWRAHLASSPSSTSSSSSAGHSASSSTAQGESGAAGPARAPRRRRRRARPYAVTFECVEAAGPQPPPDDEDGCGPGMATVQLPGDGTGAGQMMMVRTAQRHAGEPEPALPPIDYRLGGGRLDPFRSCPGPWRPYIPALTDHYIIHMAVDIPELDQPGNAGLLRSRWYPLVLSDPSPFSVILLLSAANYISNFMPAATGPESTADGLARRLRLQMLALKQAAIGAINTALRDPRRRLSDELVGAVAKMASFEAMHGDAATYRVHMDGLRRMLDLRGGIASLGLGGLLRRMVVWIDLNAAFLLGAERYFPGHTFTDEMPVPGPDAGPPDGPARVGPVEPEPEPNPARFLAVR